MSTSFLSLILFISSLSKVTYSCGDSLPIVDLSSPDAAVDLVDAFQYFGFSYVKSISVDKQIVEEAKKKTKQFFNLPNRVKRQLRANIASVRKTTRGFTGLREEQLDV